MRDWMKRFSSVLVSSLLVLFSVFGDSVFPDTNHEGYIILNGNGVLVIEDTTYFHVCLALFGF
jgi:uncharacterized membrane protein YkgB